MAFSEKRIEVSVTLASDTQANQPIVFDESGTDTVKFSGARTSVRVENSGGLAGSTAQISVWGLSLSLMNQLSTLGQVIQMIPRNRITVTAGEVGGAMTTVFKGTIQQAYADFNGAPNVPFKMECNSTGAENAIPIPASSYTGATSVAEILQALANKMGWGFENNGVDATLSNPYLWGSAVSQVRRVAAAVGIDAEIVDQVLIIAPRRGHRAGDVPLIAAPPVGTMVGWPSYTQQGLVVRSLFDPRIKFMGLVQVSSSLKRASGSWKVHKLDLALDALVPRGDWLSVAYCFNPNYPAPAIIPSTG